MRGNSQGVRQKGMSTWAWGLGTKEQLGLEDERMLRAAWAGSSTWAAAGTSEPEGGWTRAHCVARRGKGCLGGGDPACCACWGRVEPVASLGLTWLRVLL